MGLTDFRHLVSLGLSLAVLVSCGAEEWIPYGVRKDVIPGSALDFSALGLQDAPAGKYGPLKVVGDHFEFSGKPGVAQRFYGVNLCNSANYPERALAVQLADRLCRIGYNAVRIHHYDRGCTKVVDGRLTLDAEAMERLDFFAAELIRRGLYLTTDLYVSRKPKWKDLGIAERGDEAVPFKVLALCDDRVFADWCAFARLFLTHVNPYTGRAYGQEPALLFLPLVNEGRFSVKQWKSLAGYPAFQAAFSRWLREERVRDPQAFPQLKDGTIPESLDEVGGSAGTVSANFMAYLETEGVARMRAFLRDELNVRVPLTNQNCGPHFPPMQEVRENVYDFVDDHTYVDHPSFLGKANWTLPVRLGNGGKTQLGKGLCSAIADLAFTRLIDKPFTVTEWNFTAPGPHRAQGGLMMGAAGALQSWDGLWRFAYAHDYRDAEEVPRKMEFFNVGTDPVMLAGERAGILLYLRQDVTALTNVVVRTVDEASMRPKDGTCEHVKPAWANILWRAKTGTCLPGHAPAGAVSLPFAAKSTKGFVSADGVDAPVREVTFDTAREALAIATERTCGGYAPSTAGTVNAGRLRFAVESGSAAVWASALDGEGLASAKRILVSHVTDARNTDMVFSNATPSVMLKWGKAPVLVRAGRATIELDVGSMQGVCVWALDEIGNRKREIPAVREAGRIRLETDVRQPFGATFHYEVAVDRGQESGR